MRKRTQAEVFRWLVRTGRIDPSSLPHKLTKKQAEHMRALAEKQRAEHEALKNQPLPF